MNFTIKEMPCLVDGKRIFGLLYMPEGAKNAPAVIMSHGYNSSYGALTDYAEKLALNGFYAYCYDFCGGSSCSKSDGLTTDMTIYSEMNDLRAVMDMIASLSFVDGIYLYGESQGGYISALTAAQLPERIKGAMLLYPALCIPDNWRGKAQEMPDTMEFMGMTLSRKFAENIPTGELHEQIGGFKKPVLIMHGDKDMVVDIAYSERAEEYLINAKLVRFAGEGHGFSPAARESAFECIMEFLDTQEDNFTRKEG